jgi:hypothetical protein
MLQIDGAVGLVLLGLWVYCLCDVIATDSSLTRHLPKFTWLFVVIILSFVGCVLWLILGRPERAGWRPGDTTVRRPFSTRFTVRGPEDDPAYRPAGSPTPPRTEPSRSGGDGAPGMRDPGTSPELSRRHEELQAREEDLRRRELEAWEADLKRREDELRRKGDGGGLYGGNRW